MHTNSLKLSIYSFFGVAGHESDVKIQKFEMMEINNFSIKNLTLDSKSVAPKIYRRFQIFFLIFLIFAF